MVHVPGGAPKGSVVAASPARVVWLGASDGCPGEDCDSPGGSEEHTSELQSRFDLVCRLRHEKKKPGRSEEHTSELQSRFDLVCRPLLEKKNIDVLPRTPGNNVYVGFMVWSNFTATKCRGLVSLNQVIKEIICLQPLK